jgi:osmoprotectant transport system permease protein
VEGVKGGRRFRNWLPLIVVTVVFLVIVIDMDVMRILLTALFPGEKEVIYPRANLLVLLKEHMLLVLLSSFAATVIGVGVGILVTRPAGRDYLNLVNDISSLAQTIPPIAVLALAVPSSYTAFSPSSGTV